MHFGAPRRLSRLLCCLIYLGCLYPQPSQAADEAPPRLRIGLVLSGGGARGLSHVGVLKVLEREQ